MGFDADAHRGAVPPRRPLRLRDVWLELREALEDFSAPAPAGARFWLRVNHRLISTVRPIMAPSIVLGLWSFERAVFLLVFTLAVPRAAVRLIRKRKMPHG